jgi:hypothetical protein
MTPGRGLLKIPLLIRLLGTASLRQTPMMKLHRNIFILRVPVAGLKISTFIFGARPRSIADVRCPLA